MYWRGSCSGSIEDYEEAISDYSRVLELEPDDADALRWRGYCYSISENFDPA